jgi:predicted RNA-binding protein with PUA-like domain
MNFWLMKSEPSSWSWQDQIDRGDLGEGWDGVRNHQASNNMKAMQLGDLAFFYHSVNEKQIVGIVEVIGQSCKEHVKTGDAGRYQRGRTSSGYGVGASGAPFRNPGQQRPMGHHHGKR